METLRVAFSLAGVVIVIIGAYYATYYIGLKASGKSRGKFRNKNINVIDRFSISRDKSFCLVEISGKVYVVGITNQSMTLLDTLDAAAFTEAAAERRDTASLPVVQDGSFKGKLTYRMAAFMAARMGRTLESSEDAGGVSFEDSMRAARAKDTTGQPSSKQLEHIEDPEEKE
jgi:flagellar biogenesis protein FliO